MHPIAFRRTGPYPRGITPRNAAEKIRSLRQFIGAQRLATARDRYFAPERQSEGVFSLRLSTRQPLIEAFDFFDKVTWNDRRPLKRMYPEIVHLANVAALAQVVVPSLPSKLADHHRIALVNLDGQLHPLLTEWEMTAQLARLHQAEIAWTPPGASGPELIARIGSVEVDIECKYASTMVTQLLGDNEADRLGAACLEAIRSTGLRGHVTLDVPLAMVRDTDALLDSLPLAIQAIVTSGLLDADLPGGLHLKGKLVHPSGEMLHRDAWMQQMRAAQSSSARLYATAARSGDFAIDPLTVSIDAPGKDRQALYGDLWVKKFKKAAEQCSGVRGAIILIDWEGEDDPSLFQYHPLFQGLIERTLREYPYVNRIIMRCDNAVTGIDGVSSFSRAAYSAENNFPTFPASAPILALLPR